MPETTLDLRREFDRRKPWVTQFVVGSERYGGDYDAAGDVRVRWFRERFPQAETVLELGSLEGGHSFALASLPGVRRVVSVEGRKSSLEKARFVQGVLGDQKVEFVRGNLEKLELSEFGSFDVVFCSGLLYHLPRPWTLIERIARVAPGLFLWTHYASPERVNRIRNGYRGWTYREWAFLFGALSGLSPSSFWPSRDELVRMLADHGFTDTEVVDDDPKHENGPALTLTTRRDARSGSAGS